MLVLAAAPALAAGDDLPLWLQQAAATRTPIYDRDVPAVVLYQEQAVSVAEDGRVTTVSTYAVRVLNGEGRKAAEATELYLTNSGQVKDMRAWLIRPDGSVKKYGKNETIDLIADPNDIYNEYRIKSIDASDEAGIGMVFGYQTTIEERPLFNQDIWRFQDRLPTLASRYVMTLPAGWRASSITFNHASVEPTVSGSTYIWELRNLAPITPEPASPHVHNLAPRIAVSYSQAANAQNAAIKTFANWAEVSRWATALHDPQAVPDETLTAKARQLTANSKTELDRIRAIGNFVQNLQYISIDIGLGRGNGYKPHAATQVLAKLYGDCKDKANLMRAMLKTLNITAYPVAIHSGDPTYVREEWASPSQFNHCIIAIKVSDETQLATVIQHPTLGRLLIFDATDESTMLGDLPDHEQGSLALIIAGDSGSLVRMPSTLPEANRLDREADVTLTSEGSITATLRERSVGQSAVMERRAFRHLSRADYVRLIESWITSGASGAQVSKVSPADASSDNGLFALDVEFSAPNYAQSMQSRLLVFKPAIVSRNEALQFTQAARVHPVVLRPRAFTEAVRIKLPVGFEVDELPDPLKLETAFGTYQTTYEVKDGELFFRRSMTVRAATIPVEQYTTVRNFFERVRAAEQSPVVLVRK